MIKELFGCCDQFVTNDPYERRQKNNKTPAFSFTRGSRFLQVTSNPLNTTANKIPMVAKKNITYDRNYNSRYDTRASSNQQQSNKFQNYQTKPRTPITDLQGLMQSQVQGLQMEQRITTNKNY